MRRLVAILLLGAAAVLPADAQELRTAVVPATITVGDVFHAVIRVSGPAGAAATFPDTLILPESLEAAGRRRIERDTVNGTERWTALYPLTAWRPGTHSLPDASVQLAAAGAETAAPARFPAVDITSVLPADTAGVQPQPPHDVLGPDRLWWPLLLAALLLLLAAAAVLWWYRRRRAARPVMLPAEPRPEPRAAALAALDRARASGALEQGAYKRFYSDVSEALRTYVAALDAQLGPDLTTRELALRLGWSDSAAPARLLIDVLDAADLVKFARRRPGPDEALADWERARRFVETFEIASPLERRAA